MPELLDVAGMSRAFFGMAAVVDVWLARPPTRRATPCVSCSPTPSRAEDL
jgi:hypothetical protein